MNQNMAHVACLVCESALGRKGKSFRIRVEKHLRDNGPEWTSNRLKAIWNVALLLRSGDPESAKTVLQDNSISYNHLTMIPKGPEGEVVRMFLAAQRPTVLKRIAAVLRVYTSIRLDKPTRKQRQKARSSISGSYTGIFDRERILRSGQRHLEAHPHSGEARDFVSKKLSSDEIHCEHLHINSRYYSRNRLPKELKGEPYSSMVMSFMTEPWVPSILDDRVPCKEMREDARFQGWQDSQEFYGRITLIQEQGCKARIVCQPSAWLQLAFMPLHNRLAKVCEIMFPKESCVRDQESGVYQAMMLMGQGYPVYSTDLSSATDRFPVDYSLGVLRGLGLQDYAEALQEVVQGRFSVPWLGKGAFLSYHVGQPMGLYSSFPLFHLSNCCLAAACSRKVKDKVSFPNGAYFMVLGDDIIFSDSKVEACYRQALENLGVQVSESKCYHGDVCEFAGFVTLRTNKGITAFRPYKVPEQEWVTNPIQFLDSLGKSVRHLGSVWTSRYDTYRRTIGSRSLSLDPLLPSNEGDWGPAIRGDNTTVVRMSQAIRMFQDDYGYSLPNPESELTPALPGGRPNTRINRIPLFRERGVFDYYTYDRDLLMSPEFRDIERYPSRRRTMTYHCDPLITEVEAISRGERVPDPRLVSQTGPVDPLTGYGPEVEEAPAQLGHTKSPSRKLTLDERIALAKAKQSALNAKRGVPQIRKNKVFDDLDLG
jgi:hypothetical protein